MAQRQQLAAQRKGQGLPVLFIHGWQLAGSVEANDFESVFDRRSGYSRIYVDLPGMGLSPPAGVENLDSILDRLSDFIESNILPSNFLLAGSSCGAYLARVLAYKYANAVDGLLLRVPVVDPVNSKRDVDPFAPVIMNKALLSSVSAADLKRLGNITVQTADYIERLKRRLDTVVYPAIAAAESNSKILDPIRSDDERYKLTGEMHSPDTPFLRPTLIMAGRQDEVVGYRDPWSLMPSYPRATFVVLDRADHGLPVDENNLFEAMVSDWLSRVEETRKAFGRM